MLKNSLRLLTTGALLLAAGLAHADAVYTGAASAQFSSPATGLLFDNNRGTTATPMAYLAAKGGAMASSLQDNFNGGRVQSTALGSGGGADGSFGLASASSQLIYRVTLMPLPGASLGTLINIHASGSGSVLVDNAGGLSTATYSASTYLDLILNNGQALISNYDYADITKPVGGFVLDTDFSLFPGQFFDVALLAIATAGGSAYAEAFADPVFTLDPAYAAFYQLVGVPSVDVPPPTNPTPPANGVPEPSTWMLFAAGVFALAAFSRRQPGRRGPSGFAAA